MPSTIRKYRLGRSRLARGLREGFQLTPEGALRAVGGEDRRMVFLPKLDSAQEDCAWGRLAFGARLAGDAVLRVHALASNDDRVAVDGVIMRVDELLTDASMPLEKKRKLFRTAGESLFVGSSDVLLYDQAGRYLWLWFEVLGAGEGEAEISDIRVYVPGDNFFQTFPEIYRADGEFFHRYLSIFSSMYQDLQETIDSLPQLLDIDTAPAGALPIFARWLGLELGGNFLDEKHLRRLLKAAFGLVQVKGTRQAVEGVVRLFVEEPVYIVEKNLLTPPRTASEREVQRRLYGSSAYDFTVIINRKPDEKLRARLLFLIDQFKPIRSRVNIVFPGESSGMDTFSYMDINGCMQEPAGGSVDEAAALTGMLYLQ